jgi:hypothetical protein
MTETKRKVGVSYDAVARAERDVAIANANFENIRAEYRAVNEQRLLELARQRGFCDLPPAQFEAFLGAIAGVKLDHDKLDGPVAMAPGDITVQVRASANVRSKNREILDRNCCVWDGAANVWIGMCRPDQVDVLRAAFGKKLVVGSVPTPAETSDDTPAPAEASPLSAASAEANLPPAEAAAEPAKLMPRLPIATPRRPGIPSFANETGGA